MAKNIDLFQHYQKQPSKLRKIVDKWGEVLDDCADYRELDKFLEEVQSIGYTFDYYLDGSPYALRKLGIEIWEVEGYEDSKIEVY
jgi:hypothetical protein